MQFPNLTSPDLAYFDPGDGRRIAYRYRPPTSGKPTVVFLPGYASDMEGTKAVAVDAFCGQRGIGCLRLVTAFHAPIWAPSRNSETGLGVFAAPVYPAAHSQNAWSDG